MSSKEMAKVFKALSNEQRLSLFKMMFYWEKTMPDNQCCGIEKAFTKACDCMNLSRSTISHHMKELQIAGLISCEKNGQALVCNINHELVEQIKQFFN